VSTGVHDPFISIEEACCPYPSYRYFYILTFLNLFSFWFLTDYVEIADLHYKSCENVVVERETDYSLWRKSIFKNQELSTIIYSEVCSDEKIKLTRVNVPS
jgi:hypothetical protein